MNNSEWGGWNVVDGEGVVTGGFRNANRWAVHQSFGCGRRYEHGKFFQRTLVVNSEFWCTSFGHNLANSEPSGGRCGR